MKAKRELPMHFMLLPGVIVTLIFSYGPMLGLIMAFQNYIPSFGFFRSEWVGMKNFEYIFMLPDFAQIVKNTLYIATMKIVFSTVMTILIALLLNEVYQKWFKRSVQTIIYLPYFLSWIILGGVLREIMSLDGVLNKALEYFGHKPILFLGNSATFPFLLVLTDAWQTVGFGTIVYLAAITSINPALYEAALVDGASRLRQTWHITLPGMRPIIVLMLTLSIGNVLYAGFDQIYVLYSPMVYSSGDVIDTWVYRAGLVSAQYSVATAVGLFRSVISFVLVTGSYFLAYKFAKYRIF